MNSRLIGQRIARFRMRNELSTGQLAEMIGKSQATISRIENGKQKANIEVVSAIAKALKVHPFCLLSDKPLPPSEALFSGAAESGEAQEATCLGRMLSAGRRRSRLTVAEAARELDLTPEALEALETGHELPAPEQLRQLARLYPVDAKEIQAVAWMQERFPVLAKRMQSMEHLLSIFHSCLEGHSLVEGENASREWLRVEKELQEVLGIYNPDFTAAERQAEYFSIGHLSDRLLQALQNPQFHEQVEEQARRFLDKESASAPDGALEPDEAESV